MRILVLGGTSFVGRAIVQDALARGHQVTIFSRGRTNPDLFSDVERRVGDRDTGDYESLKDGSWDAVVDVSAYLPRHVQQAMDALDGRVGRYLFISTGSVYDLTKAQDYIDEDCPRLAPERGTEDITDETYGPLKVACEDDVLARYGDRATIVRPGIVAGPHDPTDRFTYWVRRAARGGRVELPGRPEQPMQVCDSRDVARLVTILLENDQQGTYNAVGESMPIADLIRGCATSPIEIVSVPQGDWKAPLVVDPSWDMLFRRSPAKARRAGMPVTPLAKTSADTRAWDLERGEPALTTEP